MTAQQPPLTLRVWGEYACFTRPEMKVERVSYPAMTPTAARGVLEAVFWKPEFTWQVEEIWVLKPINYFSILRNEVNSRASQQTATGWSRDGGGFDASADRAQRHTLGLRDVAYVIKAQQVLRSDVADDPAKYRDQFRRRVADGRCFATPYLGCREFSAGFAALDGTEQPIDVSDYLGPMLIDLQYESNGSGRATPRFASVQLEQGILRVPTTHKEG